MYPEEETKKETLPDAFSAWKKRPAKSFSLNEKPGPLLLGGRLSFMDASLQTLCAAMTAAIQFLLAFDFLVSHERSPPYHLLPCFYKRSFRCCPPLSGAACQS